MAHARKIGRQHGKKGRFQFFRSQPEEEGSLRLGWGRLKEGRWAAGRSDGFFLE